MELKRFMCSRGALGGVPSSPGDGQSRNDFIEEAGGGTTNITYVEDARMSGVIRGEIQPFRIKHGFV